MFSAWILFAVIMGIVILELARHAIRRLPRPNLRIVISFGASMILGTLAVLSITQNLSAITTAAEQIETLFSSVVRMLEKR